MKVSSTGESADFVAWPADCDTSGTTSGVGSAGATDSVTVVAGVGTVSAGAGSSGVGTL